MKPHGTSLLIGGARRAALTKLTAFALAGATALVVACNPSPDAGEKLLGVSSPRNDRKTERDAAAKVGGFHNRGLRFVGAELSVHLKTGKKTRAEILSFVEKSCTRFLKSEGRSEECHFPTEAGTVSAQISVPLILGAARRDLSPTAQNYMNQIDAAGDQASSAWAFSAALSTIETNASNNLSGEDLAAVLNVAAVSDSSAHYWEDNGDTWSENAYDSGIYAPTGGGGGGGQGGGQEPMQISTGIVFRTTQSMSRWFSWRRVFVGDMAGGIAGAFVSGAAGVGPGALAGSVYEAAAQVIDHYL